MRNGASGLAVLAAVLGLVLLMWAEPGDALFTALGSVLLVVAALLTGIGKGIDLLGHVRDGASEPDDSA